MSNAASGATVTRLFDPDHQTHFALAEEAQFELREIFESLHCLAMLTDTPPGASGPEIEPQNLAPLFRTLARHGDRVMAEARTRFPSQQQRRKSA